MSRGNGTIDVAAAFAPNNREEVDQLFDALCAAHVGHEGGVVVHHVSENLRRGQFLLSLGSRRAFGIGNEIIVVGRALAESVEAELIVFFKKIVIINLFTRWRN